jgi:hypothetical protein
VQFARTGLALQKSQIGGGGRPTPAGVFDSKYHRYGSRLAADQQKAKEDSFFDGIDTSLAGLAADIPGAPSAITGQLQALDEEVKQAADWNSREDQRNGVPKLLADVLNRFDGTIAMLEAASLPAQGKADVLHELRVKRVQANNALALALGLHFSASLLHPGQPPAHLYDTVPVKLTTSITSNETVVDLGPSEELQPPDPNWRKLTGVDVTAKQPVTQELGLLRHGGYERPYFSRPNIEQPYYDLLGPNANDLRLSPVTPPLLPVYTHVRYQNALLTLAAYAPAETLVPPVSVALPLHAQVFLEGEKSLPLNIHVHTQAGMESELTLKLGLPAHWTSEPAAIALKPLPGESATDFDRTLTVRPEPHFSAAYNARPALVKATVIERHDAKDNRPEGVDTFDEGYRAVGYGDLPRTNYFTAAEIHVVPVDLKLPAKHRIGYLAGTGDAVPEALASIGMKPEMLSVADLTADKLKGFDTVVLGVRTYAAHPDLHGAPTQALLDYAKNGGNVVVQYQTAEFTEADAPYPLTLGRDAERVVDETDPVQLLDAKSSLLNLPNKLTPADFDGWNEERGHGFLRTWDAHYAALTETHDPGEEPQRGGLVTTPLGSGRWTYLAFAVYRQLPEAVPGAYRLFVNLLQK